MKYWVYKDSQILGPLAKEDFALAGGLRPDTLVCTEDSAGRMDTDWRAAEDVEELSGAWSSAPSLPAEDGLTRPDLGVMERLRFETLGPLGEATGEDWLAELFSSESRLPAEEISRAAGPSATQETLKELTEQINRLSQRLEELEGGKVLPPPDAAPEQAKPAAPPAPKAGETRPRQAEAPRKSAPTPQAKPAAAVPDALASLPDIIVSRPAEAAPADKPAARSAAAKPAAAPPPESAGAPGGQTSGLQFRERPRRVVKFAAAKSLPSASKGGAAMAGPDRMSSAAGLRKAASGPAPLGAPPQAPAPSASPVIKPRIENAITTPPGASPYQWAPPAAAQAGIPQAGVPQAAAAGPMAN